VKLYEDIKGKKPMKWYLCTGAIVI